MGEIHPIPLVRPLAGLLSSEPGGLDQARAALSRRWGAPLAQTEAARFLHTDYYTQEMGSELWRQFLVFGALHPAEELADWKLATQQMEQDLGRLPTGGRRVNIDPGYLAPGKLVLASTKDHQHRIYLRDGIYAEITLRFLHGRFQPWEWTYPDYAEAAGFFQAAYQDYRRTLSAGRGPTESRLEV